MIKRGSLRNWALVAWVAAFLGAAANHGHDFLVCGWRPYASEPRLLEAFWTSLVLVDPVVVVLLLLRRRSGLLAGLAVMVADVAVNATVAFTRAGYATSPDLLMQVGFLGFVLGSLPWLWPVTPDERR